MRKTNLGGAVLLGAALIVLLSAIFIVRNDQDQYAVMTARSDHFKANYGPDPGSPVSPQR